MGRRWKWQVSCAWFHSTGVQALLVVHVVLLLALQIVQVCRRQWHPSSQSPAPPSLSYQISPASSIGQNSPTWAYHWGAAYFPCMIYFWKEMHCVWFKSLYILQMTFYGWFAKLLGCVLSYLNKTGHQALNPKCDPPDQSIFCLFITESHMALCWFDFMPF